MDVNSHFIDKIGYSPSIIQILLAKQSNLYKAVDILYSLVKIILEVDNEFIDLFNPPTAA